MNFIKLVSMVVVSMSLTACLGGGGSSSSSSTTPAPKTPNLLSPTALAATGCTVVQQLTGADFGCSDGSTATVANGTNGTNGTNGSNGAAGAASTVAGPQGPAGTNGTNGTNGAAGAAGATGPQGPAGPAGAAGAQGPAGAAGAAGAAGSALVIHDVNGTVMTNLVLVMSNAQFNWFLNTVTGHTVAYANTYLGGVRSPGQLFYTGVVCTGTPIAASSAFSGYFFGEVVTLAGSYYAVQSYTSAPVTYQSYYDTSCHGTGGTVTTGSAVLGSSSLITGDYPSVAAPIQVSVH